MHHSRGVCVSHHCALGSCGSGGCCAGAGAFALALAAGLSSSARFRSRLFPRDDDRRLDPRDIDRSPGGDLLRRCSAFSLCSRYLFLIQFEIFLESSLSLLSLLDTSTRGAAAASVLIVVRSDVSPPVVLGPSLLELLREVPLALAVALDPMTGRGEARGGKGGGETSSFFRDRRHRRFFSFSLGVSGIAASAGAGASSSTWSRSEPSLNELWSEVGGDFLDRRGIWALLG